MPPFFNSFCLMVEACLLSFNPLWFLTFNKEADEVDDESNQEHDTLDFTQPVEDLDFFLCLHECYRCIGKTL